METCYQIVGKNFQLRLLANTRVVLADWATGGAAPLPNANEIACSEHLLLLVGVRRAIGTSMPLDPACCARGGSKRNACADSVQWWTRTDQEDTHGGGTMAMAMQAPKHLSLCFIYVFDFE